MMKLLIVCCALLVGVQDEMTRDIGIAMKAGSSKELIKFCNNTVEIKVDGESSNYSKNQAEVILRDFFSRNPPKDFTYIHHGESEGLKYKIGHYRHQNGVFRVVMVIKKINDTYLIDTLNFSKD